MEFDQLEQKYIALSLKRYNRPFFRWGHLLGWLALPLLLLMLVPPFKPYGVWLSSLGILLIFHWYFVVTTRIIGKLKSNLDAANSQQPQGPAKPAHLR